jgi:L-2-hydroxyglutarate oxidase
MNYDVCIIGGGIIGLSTAWQLKKRLPKLRMVLLEKENELARHQTGHNSGVIHAGVYYAPGSLKAKFCKQGVKDTIEFCQSHNIPFDQCGKLIVATDETELSRLDALFQRCQQNGITSEVLSGRQLKQREPSIQGLGALWSPTTGIVDYRKICSAMAREFTRMGGEIRMGSRVSGIQETESCLKIQSTGEALQSGFLISCAGLQADRITQMMGLTNEFQIIPYRGEYFRLPKHLNRIVNHLIYPVPDPELPFLGVHLTRMIDGSVTVGPNAVQGFKREGYGKLNVDVKDTLQMLSFPGFWRVTKANLKTGFNEYKNSLLKTGYLNQVRKYCPSISLADLQPYPAGIRAQAVLKDGSLVHDFLFMNTEKSLHVCNAPSPAATSAIPIGQYICDKVNL